MVRADTGHTTSDGSGADPGLCRAAKSARRLWWSVARMQMLCSVLPRPMSSARTPCRLYLSMKPIQLTPSCWYRRRSAPTRTGICKLSILDVSSNCSRNRRSSVFFAARSALSPSGSGMLASNGSSCSTRANVLVMVCRTAACPSDMRPRIGTTRKTAYGSTWGARLGFSVVQCRGCGAHG